MNNGIVPLATIQVVLVSAIESSIVSSIVLKIANNKEKDDKIFLIKLYFCRYGETWRASGNTRYVVTGKDLRYYVSLYLYTES